MYDWITANLIWILLGIGVSWLVFRRGGMGCGMGGHGGHDHPEQDRREGDSNAGESHAGHDTAGTPRRQHRGC